MKTLILSLAGTGALSCVIPHPSFGVPPSSVTLCGAAALYCQPYAEKCPACKDCSACGHCTNGGRCSVCFKK